MSAADSAIDQRRSNGAPEHERRRQDDRLEDLQRENDEIEQSRRAALNLMEDADTARRRAEKLNEELSREVTERRRAEEAVEEDLRNMELLRELGARVFVSGDTQGLYEEILATAIKLTRADAGTVQVMDPVSGDLIIVATRGFERAVTEHFRRISATSATSCGVALACGKRVLLDFDPQSDPDGSARMHREAGYMSAQSTPLIDRSGKPVGMVSTHWRNRRRPTERENRFLDLFARQAADMIERQQFDAALRESEEKYRMLFNSIDEGFCIIEMLFDENGQAFDYRFLQMNPAFERQTGIVAGQGRTMLEFAPGHEKFWFEVYGEIARTGEPRRFEHGAEALSPPRWYDVYAFRVGAPAQGRVAVIFNDVSERRRSERALSRANELLQATFDYSAQIIQLFKAVRDERGEIVDFEWLLTNKNWNDRWGERAGRRLLTENPSVIETGLFERFKRVTETGVPDVQEHYYPNEQFEGWQSAAKVEDGFLLSTLDITERKRAEKALRMSEQRLQRMINVPRVGVLNFDQNGTIIFANDAFLEVIGYTREELGMGAKSWRDFTPPEHVEASDRAMKQLMETGRGGPYEKEYFRKDGTRVWLMFVAFDLGDGTIAEYVIDVSDRKAAEEAFREGEQRLQALVKNLPGGAVFIVDKDLRYLVAEGEALGPAGFKSEDFIGRRVDEVVSQEHAEEFTTNYRQALAGESFETEHDSHGRSYLTRGVPLTNAEGNVYAVLALSSDITERRQAERALHESEENFRAMFEQTRVGIVQVAPDGKFIAVNPAYAQLMGYRSEELLQMNGRDVTHPDDLPRELEMIEQLFAGKIKSYILEKRYIRKDGEVIWGQMTGAMVHGGERHPNYILGTVEAIGERKRAEEQLRFSEERFRQFAENSADVFWIMDAKANRLEYVNPVYEKMFGQSRELILKDRKNRLKLVPEDDREEAAKGLAEAREGKVFVRNYRIVRPTDGETRWIRDTGFPIYDHTGEVVRIAGVAQDVTEDKERIEALRESEEKLRLLIEGAPNYAMMMLDPSNHIIYWSEGAERVFGWSADEALGKSGEMIFTPEDRANEAEEKEMAIARKNGSAPDRRWHLRKDGSRIWVDGIMHRLDAENGELRGYAKIARDATEQRAAEGALRQARDELERRVQERTSELQATNDALAGEITHRQSLEREILEVTERERARISQDLHDSLCQELTATAFLLKSSAKSFIKEDPEAAEALEEAAETVNNNAGRARDLARGLQPFELSGGLPSALRELCSRLQERIACRCEAPRTMRLDENIAVNLYRIAQEALTNAAKHAKPSEINVCLERKGSEIVLKIKDNGKTKTGKLKPGMGMHMMQYRANAIGGTLEIQSEKGQGTKIVCRVPMKR